MPVWALKSWGMTTVLQQQSPARTVWDCINNFNTADSWEKKDSTVAVFRLASAELPYVHICSKVGRSTSTVKISGTYSYCITSRLYLDCGELATLQFFLCLRPLVHVLCHQGKASTRISSIACCLSALWCVLETCVKKFLILRIQRYIIKSVYRSPCEVHFILVTY